VQDAAIAPARPGRRKVVLSTSIAETSLTIEGIRIVVDGGLARVPRLDHRRGMAALATVSVSQSSAEQRRGRAGRTAAGVCHRLWSGHDQPRLPAAAEPEILVADLAPLALDLARWGVADPGELAWLDPPPPAALGAARTVLRELGALGDDLRITPEGRRMSGLGLHPRLARMVLGADAWDATGVACDLAALLSERDIVGGRPTERGADVRERLVLLRGGRSGDATLRRVRRQSAALRRRLGAGSQHADDLDRAGPVLALAYPDRIARRRAGATGDPRYLLADGTGASLPGSDPLARSDLVVVADRMPAVRGTHRGDDLIVLAAAIDLDDVEAVAGPDIEQVEEVSWDSRAGEVTARRQRRLGAVVLADAALADPPHDAAVAALLDGVRAEGLGLLPFTPEIEQWRHRVGLLRRVLGDDWPDVGDDALLDGLDGWLAPSLGRKARRRADLARVPLQASLEARLDWDRRRRLDELAPTHVQVPSGSRIRIDYAVDPPVLAVRLQEVFGLTVTPAVVGGRVPLVLHLLSPAGRPVQVTADLAGFWSGAYAQVRSELRGRYPRHSWPDDPLTAPPTRRPTNRRRPG
jgi:ATP-dependent helicase HrpB